jgi:uncharacterized protein YndB with AHSA1/START domain
MTITAANSLEQLQTHIALEIDVDADIETTFAAVLEELTVMNGGPEPRELHIKLEPWPGGRWYRDLGDNNGHFWGHVQAIKRPTLIELCGPFTFSSAFMLNVQYRLSEKDGRTHIKFHHDSFGYLSDEQRKGMTEGWTRIFNDMQKRAVGK